MPTALLDLATLDFAPASTAGNFSILPLLRRNTPQAYWLTLDEAMARGVARITEVSDGGTVPTLLFINSGEQPVLLLDGEELVGAKQNRILNLSLLVPPQSEMKIPVSCVEQGRWRWRAQHFESSDRAFYASGRAAKMQQVSHSMRSGSSYNSDQREIWDSIAEKMVAMDVRSETSAASALYETRAAHLDQLVATARPLEDQIGAAFLVDGRLKGVELFGATSTCAALLPKLVRSYGLDALSSMVTSVATKTGTAPQQANSPNVVLSFLQSLFATTSLQKPALGLGEDHRFESPDSLGAGLMHDGRLVHLSAFTR